MYTLCTTEKAAQQQYQLELALLDLLFEIPYDSITISEICRRAGLSRKVFYRLFEQKADVIYALIDHVLLEYDDFEPGANALDKKTMSRFFRYWKHQKRLLDALETCSGGPLLMDRAIRHVLQEDRAALQAFGANAPKYEREIIVFFLSGLFYLVLDWHKSGFQHSVEEMASLGLTLLTQPPVNLPRSGR